MSYAGSSTKTRFPGLIIVVSLILDVYGLTSLCMCGEEYAMHELLGISGIAIAILLSDEVVSLPEWRQKLAVGGND